MLKTITVSYLNRNGIRRDILPIPKIILANKSLLQSGFSIGDKVSVEYLLNQVIITKLT